jgi:hypothetical protein
MLLHQFFGTGEYDNRVAFVFKESDDLTVMFVRDQAILKEVWVSRYSEQAAEDMAENWVLGGTLGESDDQR